MNIESLSDDNLNAVQWINMTYKNSDKNIQKEEFVSSLVSKLQLYHEQVNEALEETSHQVISILPRVIKDANSLQTEVIFLQNKMKEVQLEIEQVQNETGSCMSNLERLDTLKEKLLLAKDALQESDGWGKLVLELEDLYERNDLWKICEKLQMLQKSLIAQEKLPGQSERQNQVEGFKNRLEALASPAVVQCFSSGDVEQTKKYVAIFTNMDRMPQLLQYYKTVQKTALQQHWSEIIDLSENSNRFLSDFYEFLAESFVKQSKWCNQVFGNNGIKIALNIVTEILPTLLPSRETTILDALKCSNDKLDVLLEFSKSNIMFINLMRKYLQSIGDSSKLFQLIPRPTLDYFNTFIAQYPAIEQNNLATSAANLNVLQTTPIETIRALGNGNKKILEWCREAIVRCDKITQNLAICPLATVITSILKNFIEKYKKAQQQLSASRSKEQNWSLLQSSMSLLQNIGDFSSGLQKLEIELSERIVEKDHEIQTNKNESESGYRLVERRDINELRKLALKIKEEQRKIETETLKQNFIVFSSVYEQLKPVCVDIHDATLSVIFAPIENYLQSIEPVENFNASGADLPDYSYAPQEWLTQIGQYLLTLPQHLEPLLLAPSPSLKAALEICDTKYHENIPSADILLSLVVEESCVMYQNQILQMKSVTPSVARQLATDIEYLENVLDELGCNVTANLQQIATLLRASPENYLSMSSGCEPRLVTAIRQMRKIISTE